MTKPFMDIAARWVVLGGVFLSISAGWIQVAHQWRRINGDGVSYIQMGEALIDSALTSGYTTLWSPLYGILAAGSSRMAEALQQDRLIGVQSLNALLHCVNVACCLYFVTALARSLRLDARDWRSIILKLYSLSVVTLLTVRFGGVSLATPDLLVSSLSLLAGAETLRMTQRTLSWGWAARLGLIFGLGYWAKSTFLPLWPVWLALAAVILRDRRQEWKYLLCSCAVWLLLAAPLAAGISKSAGRWSLGEAGRLNYLWHVNRLPNRYWTEETAKHGKPQHPMKRLLEDPAIYEFGAVFPHAAYPPGMIQAIGMPEFVRIGPFRTFSAL